MIYIFDIDSTIADNSHRASFLEKHCVKCGRLPVDNTQHRARCRHCGGEEFAITQASWDKFLDGDLMLKDAPIPKAQAVIKYLSTAGGTFHFLTGRNESFRDVTQSWLNQHFFVGPTNHLLMRPLSKANTPASEYKEDQVQKLIRSLSLDIYPRPLVFFDDDPHVLGMYQKYGLVFKAPECWAWLNPAAPTTKESQWRE